MIGNAFTDSLGDGRACEDCASEFKDDGKETCLRHGEGAAADTGGVGIRNVVGSDARSRDERHDGSKHNDPSVTKEKVEGHLVMRGRWVSTRA